MLQDSNPKFLIVDDEPTIVEIVTSMLLPCAYDIRKAYDGEEEFPSQRTFARTVL